MIDPNYSKLKTVGLEVFENSLILKSKNEDFPELNFSKIKKISLEETNQKDYSGFLSYLIESFNRLRGNHISGTPSKIYKLSIILKDGEYYNSKIQDFDLIGVSRAIEKLNQNFTS